MRFLYFFVPSFVKDYLVLSVHSENIKNPYVTSHTGITISNGYRHNRLPIVSDQ